MAVDLIDPNEAINKFAFANGVPEYETMQIFAELTAQRRGRTIIMSNGSGIFDVQKTIDSDLTVNMLGPDRDTNTFTTDWTKPSTGADGVFEGFGITKINVKTNSSFVPVVSIDFVDIRGLSFFNVGKDSPYAVLHDFPPPMFNLTLKGYYGKSLTYQLHLVRQNTSFDSETGNYNTTAEFIARTFAPLTDVLFKYAELFPLMRKDTAQLPAEEANAEPTGIQEPLSRAIQPNGTHNLLVNIETLYIRLAKILKDSPEKKELEEKQQTKEIIEDLLKGIGKFSARLGDEYYTDTNTAMLHVNESVGNESDNILLIDKFEHGINVIENFSEYWDALASDGDTGVNLENKLFLGIKLNTQNVNPNNISSTFNGITLDDAQNRKARTTIINYRKTLIDSYPPSVIKEVFEESKIDETAINDIIPFNDIDSLKYVLEYKPDNTYNKHYYVVINITRFYQKIYRYYTNDIILQIDNLERILGDKINKFATDELDMSPTIRNIFKIICNDVDVFFNEMRKTAVNAQIHHNEPVNYSKINNERTELPDQKNSEKKIIDAFPLYIEQTVQSDLSKNNNQSNCKRITRKQKAYPGKPKGVGLSTTTPFPEVELVEKFMQVFIDIRNDELIRNIRNNQNVNGDLIFIPATPYDSKLGNDDAYQSPYIATSDIDSVGISDQSLNRILYNLLNRFYIFSQYTYAESFYKSESTTYRNAIIKFGGQSEASNVAISISNKENADNIIKQLEIFKNNLSLFYKYLNDNKILNYNNTNINSILLGVPKTNFEPIYKKKGDNYFGLKILTNKSIVERGGTTDDPVGKLIDNVNVDNNFFETYYKSLFGTKEKLFTFSQENVEMIKDVNDNENGNTRYIFSNKKDNATINTSVIFKLITIFSGSQSFPSINNDKVLLDFLKSSVDPETKYFLITSLFTFSKTILTNIKNNDHENIIDIPAAINVPLTFLLYSGGMLKYNNLYKADLVELFKTFKNIYYDEDDKEYLNESHSLRGGAGVSGGEQTDNGGKFSVDDIKIDEDLSFIQFLSTGDTETIINFYDNWIGAGNASTLLDTFIEILENGVTLNNFNLKNEYYTDQLENNDIISSLYSTNTLVNYSELTLSKKTITEADIGTDPNRFVSLSETNEDATLKDLNDDFFNAFIIKALDDIEERKEFLKEQEIELLSALEDTDIKTQTYYSFKNISDKWISGFGNDQKGFPFNKTPYNLQTRTGGLIDQFIFVDRAFNDIGDKVIINLKPLLEYTNDYDSSIFSVFSRILALNGFEFFPLQNFMSYNNSDWKDSFKIFETQEQEANPAFVCMYVGGVSSKLNTVISDDVFENDGIGSFDERDEIPDFYQNEIFDCDENNQPSTTNNAQDKQDAERNINIDATNSAYNQVKAFRVRFAEQDQAVFKNIHLDTREFKDTNESLAILSEIAQDKSYATPVPKGQNLFNTFEQRSYSCTVDMLGDMMIQPTQYFQLENIPLFSGAYLILNVEHEFTANHASTSFMGVRILKYPVPYVIDFASTAGLKSSAVTDESNVSENNNKLSADGNVVAYVGMNDLKINIKEN